MARQPLRVAIFVTVSMLQAAAWEIKDNAYYSYFNVAGDVSEELQRGMRIKLNGEIYEVTVSHGQSGDDTYVQLDRDHEANPGDTFELADEDAELPYGTTTSTTTVQPPKATRKPKAESNTEFGADLPFVSAVNVDDIRREVAEKQKPGIVFVTQPWCGACKNLKRSINQHDEVKELMENFVVVHAAEEAGNQWQAPGQQDGYIPRLYFLDLNGNVLDVVGPNAQHSHFFPDGNSVKKGMEQTLAKVGKTEL